MKQMTMNINGHVDGFQYSVFFSGSSSDNNLNKVNIYIYILSNKLSHWIHFAKAESKADCTLHVYLDLSHLDPTPVTESIAFYMYATKGLLQAVVKISQ